MRDRRAVILDRDGTLVDVVRDEETGVVTTAFHPSQLRLLPGVVTGLRRLQSAGFLLAIATNQPGAAKGHFSRAAIERTNAALVALLAAQEIRIARLETCLHHPDGGPGGEAELVRTCDCRKPQPGLLTRITSSLALTPGRSWMVGDSPSDVVAGARAGMRTALLLTRRRCELCPLRLESSSGSSAERPDIVSESLEELASLILSETSRADFTA